MDAASPENPAFGFLSNRHRVIQIRFTDGYFEHLIIGNENPSVHSYYGSAKNLPGVLLISKRKLDEIILLARQLDSKKTVSEK